MAEALQPSILIGLTDCTVNSQADIDLHLPSQICLVGDLEYDEEVLEATKMFSCPIVTTDNAADKEYVTYFVLSDFDSKDFEEIQRQNKGARILGKPAFIEMSKDGILSYKSRPIFCLVMKNCVLAYTGFKKKSELMRILKLVNYMGGSVKNQITDRVTHILAHSAAGEKYQYAVTFDIPVMGEDWINAAWAHREEIGVRAEAETFMRYKLKMFHNLRIALVGFSDEDQTRMEELVLQNGGFITTTEDATTTHVVLDDQNLPEKPTDLPEKAFVVKGEWFWVSIQMDACANEQAYVFEPNLSLYSPRTRLFSPGTPGSRSRRRKRLRETVQQLAENESPSLLNALPASKRRSSVGDLAFLSVDGSLLEDSLPAVVSPCSEKLPLSPPVVDMRALTPRQRVFHELVKTECNYVATLDTIEKVIKEPLENRNQPGGPMLDSQELKYIFGNLHPIHEVHRHLRDDLLYLAHHWSDEASIGDIILNYTADLERAYPPYVNYLQHVKDLLQKICKERPRFHAFLKIAQNKPECNRQDFQSLLVRPIQRLPSMKLLIDEIRKHTDKNSPDYAALEKALDRIISVTTFVNDDKRKTEAKLKLFEIHNDIENCPPNLVASHRTYVSKVDVTELSDCCSGRGDPLSLFQFNDVLEICKRKNKFNSLKSPSRVNLNQSIRIKQYKHLEMLSLAHIKRVVDINETDDCHNVFAIIVRSNQDLKERLYTYTIVASEETTKQSFIRGLCINMANVVSRSDVENFSVSMDPHHLDIETSDVSLTNALSKAIRFAARTGRKVSRAFSFNKSPGRLKRAVSTVMSPFGSLVHQGMRGATSVNNLADLSLTPTSPNHRGIMPAPITTPTPRRRPLIKRL